MASVSKNRQGKWVVRWRDAQDRQHSKVIPGPKANALKLKADIEARQALGHLYEAEPETLGVYLEGWLGRETQRVRVSTVQRRREALRGLGVLSNEGGDARARSELDPRVASEAGAFRGSSAVRPEPSRKGGSPLASEYLHHITAAEIEDAVSELASHAPRQAQMALASLKIALKNADTRGQRFDRRILDLKAPRYDERTPRFLTWTEVENLTLWMPEESKRIVPIAVLTGLRQGELFRLMESDLDLDGGVLIVRAGKTNAARRSVDLPPLAVRLLREQLLARPHTEILVFPAPQGGRWNANNFMERVFRRALRRAAHAHTQGKTGPTPYGTLVVLGRRSRLDEALTFHDLRHTAASLMIASRWHAKEIADQLGHVDGGALILRRYGHLYAGARKKVALALDEFVREEQAKAAEDIR